MYGPIPVRFQLMNFSLSFFLRDRIDNLSAKNVVMLFAWLWDILDTGITLVQPIEDLQKRTTIGTLKML